MASCRCSCPAQMRPRAEAVLLCDSRRTVIRCHLLLIGSNVFELVWRVFIKSPGTDLHASAAPQAVHCACRERRRASERGAGAAGGRCVSASWRPAACPLTAASRPCCLPMARPCPPSPSAALVASAARRPRRAVRGAGSRCHRTARHTFCHCRGHNARDLVALDEVKAGKTQRRAANAHRRAGTRSACVPVAANGGIGTAAAPVARRRGGLRAAGVEQRHIDGVRRCGRAERGAEQPRL